MHRKLAALALVLTTLTISAVPTPASAAPPAKVDQAKWNSTKRAAIA